MREIADNGFNSQPDLAAHLGLGGGSIVDLLIAERLSGTAQTVENVDTDQLIRVIEDWL